MSEKDKEKAENVEKLKKTSSKNNNKLNKSDAALLDAIQEDLGPEAFQIISLLGVGSQGRVYLVQLKNTDKYYAMKVFKKDKIINNEKTIRSILTEHRFLATSQHPFITQLLYSFHSHERLFMVMEFCAGGELFTLIKRQPLGRLTEDQVRFYSTEVLLVLEFVHSKGYIYRDLKPENILIHEDGHIRMADFGLSKQSEGPVNIQVVEKKEKKSFFGKTKSTVELAIGEVLQTDSLVGSVHYLAPEVLISSHGYNVMADWWGFGVLLYDMLFGFPPFQGNSNEEIIRKIINVEYAFPDDIPASPQIKSLIKSLLKANPKKRICAKHGASDIKAHPFFEGTNWGLLRHRTPPILPSTEGPCDISNFLLYEEDRDSIEFQFFSELEENPEAIPNEFQEQFQAFNFRSNSFEGILNQRKLSLSDCAVDKKDKKKKKEKKKDGKNLDDTHSDTDNNNNNNNNTPIENNEEVAVSTPEGSRKKKSNIPRKD